ncbi:hypothetical protein [Erysipelothrix larvae]|uniref:hypothetical protein n=1 Tax=Erysipelothrix larvae TaxID=1514105 RepID=UPI0018E0A099|nr:hypothetical protein [Erysipelothrix larvae]
MRIGFLINGALLITNRFIKEVSDGVAIPIMGVGIACMFLGFYKNLSREKH